MKKFSFIILEKMNTDLPSGTVIECEAPEWDDICIKEKFIGDPLDVSSIRSFLQTAYCMFGHIFNIDTHTPRQLYEALISNNAYTVILEGDIPENPLEYEEIPQDTCD